LAQCCKTDYGHIVEGGGGGALLPQRTLDPLYNPRIPVNHIFCLLQIRSCLARCLQVRGGDQREDIIQGRERRNMRVVFCIPELNISAFFTQGVFPKNLLLDKTEGALHSSSHRTRQTSHRSHRFPLVTQPTSPTPQASGDGGGLPLSSSRFRPAWCPVLQLADNM